jgi:hypothetical protein
MIRYYQVPLQQAGPTVLLIIERRCHGRSNENDPHQRSDKKEAARVQSRGMGSMLDLNGTNAVP